MAKYIPGRNYIGSSEIATDFNVTGPATFADTVFLGDNDKLKFGGGNDLEIFHDGSNSYINQRNTGNLIIQASSADKDIILKSDDGSGSATAYLTLDGSAGHTVVHKEIQLEDNVPVRFGTSNDAQMSHSGSDFYFANAIGDVDFYNHQDDGDISFFTDNGSGGTTEYLRLDGGIAKTVFSKDALFTDSAKANFGSNLQLTIKHDGSNAEIKTVAGDLTIKNAADQGDIAFQADNGSTGTTTYFRLDGGDLSVNILTQKVVIANLPTSDPVVDGQLWNDSGALKVSAGE